MSDEQRGLTRIDYEYQLFADPKLLPNICLHVANGGSLINLAKQLKVQYSQLRRWVREDVEREKQYQLAINDREEWAKELVLSEIRALGSYDIRMLYDDDGNLRPTNEWPDDIARAVAGLEVVTEFETVDGNKQAVGTNKKVKLVDRLKALELAAKNMAMLTDKQETTHLVTLDQLILATQKSKDVTPTDPKKD